MRSASTTADRRASGSSSGMRQSSGLGHFRGLIVGHSSTTPFMSRADRLVRRRGSPAAATPRRASSDANVLSTASRMVGAERKEKFSGTRLERPLRVAMALLEEAPHFGELLRRRALEGEDRLLLVADREHGALGRTRAGAGEELRRQRREDAPLLGGRVLRLVDEQVVEPVVELVQHPGGARPRHQRERLRDLVVEVERAALGLGSGEGRQDRLGDAEQGLAALERLARRAAFRAARSGGPARDEDLPRAMGNCWRRSLVVRWPFSRRATRRPW